MLISAFWGEYLNILDIQQMFDRDQTIPFCLGLNSLSEKSPQGMIWFKAKGKKWRVLKRLSFNYAHATKLRILIRVCTGVGAAIEYVGWESLGC